MEGRDTVGFGLGVGDIEEMKIGYDEDVVCAQNFRRIKELGVYGW